MTDDTGAAGAPTPARTVPDRTVPERIAAAARTEGVVTFVTADDHETVSWAALHDDARSMAASLAGRGVQPGDHVVVLGPTSRALVTAIQAVWWCGAVLVMAPLPMRMGSLDEFVAQTRRRIRAARAAAVVLDADLAEVIGPALQSAADGPPMIRLDELAPTPGDDGARSLEPPSVDLDSLAMLQFTSGSTSEPKGVMLTHRQLGANMDGCWSAAQMTLSDTVVSWLPLYHDMGLNGLLCIPMTTGVGLVQASPRDFLTRPGRWMQWVSEFGGTITAGPNFAFALARRSVERSTDLDLRRLRVLLNGAEPIDPEVFRGFVEAGRTFGLDPGAAFPAFGMAEVCIAATFPVPGSGLRTDVVAAAALEVDGRAVPVDGGATDGGATDDGSTDHGARNVRELAMLGTPIPGLEMRIVQPATGELCEDRQVGELQLRGTSVTTGYFEQPEATAQLLAGGWLHTGDLAYLVDGELVVCGRIKDVIIIGGRNIHPQDIERVVGSIEGVRAGNIIAFGDSGSHGAQFIVVVAETRSADLDDLRRQVVRVVTDEVGVPPREVVLVPPGTLPKTSSGKLQRSACRQAFRRGDYSPSDSASSGSAPAD